MALPITPATEALAVALGGVMPGAITQAGLDRLLEETPGLTAWGYASEECRRRRERISPECLRNDGPPALSEVQACARWLDGAPTVRTTQDSYTAHLLKHLVGEAGSMHVSNGSFVAACLLMGVPVRQVDDSPNPQIGLRKSWVDARRGR